MGEAFRRMRAAAFQHQRQRSYQKLIDLDLLRISRGTKTRFEVHARVGPNTGLAQGSECVIRKSGGSYEIIYGNMVIGALPAEANDTIAACAKEAPSLSEVMPCRVSRIGTFGGVSFELGDGNDDAP